MNLRRNVNSFHELHFSFLEGHFSKWVPFCPDKHNQTQNYSICTAIYRKREVRIKKKKLYWVNLPFTT